MIHTPSQKGDALYPRAFRFANDTVPIAPVNRTIRLASETVIVAIDDEQFTFNQVVDLFGTELAQGGIPHTISDDHVVMRDTFGFAIGHRDGLLDLPTFKGDAVHTAEVVEIDHAAALQHTVSGTKGSRRCLRISPSPISRMAAR